MIYSRNEENFVEKRPTASAMSDIALAADYEFTGMFHVNHDGLLTVNAGTLERVNRTTNIIHGMGHILVIPIKPGFVDEQPRRRNLTLIMFNLLDALVCCFVPKLEKHQFKLEYRDRNVDMPNMLPTYSRRLLLRMQIVLSGALVSLRVA